MRKRIMRWRGYEYEPAKRMWSKARSDCCNERTKIGLFLRGKPVKKPFGSLSYKDREIARQPPVCMKCGKICKLNWKFKYARN